MDKTVKKKNSFFTYSNLVKIWKNHRFELVVFFCLCFLGILWLYQKISGKKGTWDPINTKKYWDNKKEDFQKKKRSPPPKESKGEVECKRILEKLFFPKKFDKARPDFLRNPVTGGNFNLELDCYNKDLKLAVEYNGKQHYEYIPYFHRNKDAFTNQKYRDDMKRRMCKDENIILIEVPYTVEVEKIEVFLIKELNKYFNLY
jgi:hypothetical protein